MRRWKPWPRRRIVMKTALVTLLILIGAIGSAPGDSGQDSCITCHALLEDARLVKPAQLYDGDIHHQARLTCADCHGGTPTMRP